VVSHWVLQEGGSHDAARAEGQTDASAAGPMQGPEQRLRCEVTVATSRPGAGLIQVQSHSAQL